jgi:hypothetical protein
MESIPASPAQRKALKIAELREACELAGVDTTGTKAVLLDRLEEVRPFNCHISRSIRRDGDSITREPQSLSAAQPLRATRRARAQNIHPTHFARGD